MFGMLLLAIGFMARIIRNNYSIAKLFLVMGRLLIIIKREEV